MGKPRYERTVRSGVIGNTLSGVIGYIYPVCKRVFPTRLSAKSNRDRHYRGFEWEAEAFPGKTPAGCLASHRTAMLAPCVSIVQLQAMLSHIKSVTYHPG
jgi:hypothetical protein